MIRFELMSITLLICALQGLVLAWLLARSRVNRVANRWLALLILAVVALITPFIIGYAGFYGRWQWLSFAPLSYTLAFGPLVYLYTASLIGRAPGRVWPHFAPVAVQFAAYALVFPFPLEMKNRWDSLVHAPVIDPLLEAATLVSLAAYGLASWRRYRAYRRWLDDNRTDGTDFDPGWIRNFLVALLGVAIIWAGFMLAKALDPARDYADQFGLYLVFSALVLYLGIAGWRYAATRFPLPAPPSSPEPAPPGKDWTAQGALWLARVKAEQLWRDPDLTLAALARILGTNTSYLSRGLGAASGENFNAVVNRYRVEEVQRLLASSAEGRDLLTLAFEAGFNSKASFNRAFRDLAGMSPSAWRLKSQKSARG